MLVKTLKPNREQKINPCICNQLIFDQNAKNAQGGKDIVLFKRYWGKLNIHTQQSEIKPMF